MSIIIREMQLTDINSLISLWKRTEGFGLDIVDNPGPLEKYLIRNQGLCFIAIKDDKLIASILCGQDGRRGYLHRLVVDPAYRGQGIAKQLIEHSIKGLSEQGIEKCHSLVFNSNERAITLYSKTGWKKRDELKVYSYNIK